MAGGAAIGGGVIGAVGGIMAGQGQANALNYEAQVAQMNATTALTSAKLNADKQSLQAQKIMGQASANYGASGVSATSGSVLNVMAASAANAELDRQNTIYGGQLKATNYENQASLDKFGAGQAITGGYLRALGSLAGAGAQASNLLGGGSAAGSGTAGAASGLTDVGAGGAGFENALGVFAY